MKLAFLGGAAHEHREMIRGRASKYRQDEELARTCLLSLADTDFILILRRCETTGAGDNKEVRYEVGLFIFLPLTLDRQKRRGWQKYVLSLIHI